MSTSSPEAIRERSAAAAGPGLAASPGPSVASRSLRIVHLITGLETGGAENMLWKLLTSMDRSRFENRVVSLTTDGLIGPRLRERGIDVTSLGMRRGVPSVSAMRRLGRILRQFHPDLLQTWLYHSDLLGLIAGKLNRVPRIIWNVRCSTIAPKDFSFGSAMTRRSLRPLSRFPSAVIFNSRAGAEVHRREGYSPRQTVVIPNGFDLNLFRPDSEARTAVRREFGFGPDTVVIGHVGRFHPMKDYPTLLAALAKVCAEHPEARAILVGAAITPNNEKLTKLLTELELTHKVRLLGERSDIPRLLNGFDLVVLSSYSEGFPNVVGEAMACGVPCIATDVGDARWIVGETGKIVPPRNPEALANVIAELIQLGPEPRRRLGTAARERIEREFSLPAVVRQYQELYQELGPQT